jgi:SP family myo-inositol transporter-like MFS transporter 13
LYRYDAGVISGALPYIHEDFPDVRNNLWLEQLVVSSTVAAAAVGAAAGGWVSDALGRRTVLIRADLLFIAGALAMALAPNSGVLILGRALVGLGVVGLYKLNPVDPSRLKAPGFNP